MAFLGLVDGIFSPGYKFVLSAEADSFKDIKNKLHAKFLYCKYVLQYVELNVLHLDFFPC